MKKEKSLEKLWKFQFDIDEINNSKLNEAVLISPKQSRNASVNKLFSAGSRYELASLVENIECQSRKKKATNKNRVKKIIDTSSSSDDDFQKQPQISTGKKIRMHQLKQVVLNQMGKMSSMENCPICFNDIKTLEACQIEPCNHLVCQVCMKEWAEKYKSNCPYCRTDFKSVWPVTIKESGIIEREKEALDLNLNQKKWEQEFDDFYYEEDEQDQSQNICMVCKEVSTFYLMLICDNCNSNVCHTFCDPAINAIRVPEDNWYCLECRKSKMNYSICVTERNRQRQRSRPRQQQYSRNTFTSMTRRRERDPDFDPFEAPRSRRRFYLN